MGPRARLSYVSRAAAPQAQYHPVRQLRQGTLLRLKLLLPGLPTEECREFSAYDVWRVFGERRLVRRELPFCRLRRNKADPLKKYRIVSVFQLGAGRSALANLECAVAHGSERDRGQNRNDHYHDDHLNDIHLGPPYAFEFTPGHVEVKSFFHGCE